MEVQRKNNIQAILDAQESERKIIAREIHDNLGPLLSISVLQTDSLLEKTVLTAESGLIEQIKKQLKEAVLICRQVSHELTPLLHTGITLKEMISHYVEQINATGKLFIQMKYSADSILIDEKKATSLCRVITELFHNTVKHANATEANLCVDLQNSYFVIDYADNGGGIKKMEKKKGIGMSNINSRISLLDGTVSVSNNKSKGFKIFIRIPVTMLQ